ncbi:MAG: PEP-CTERM-box response regulator transcription factor [Verrucomicrobia bacterium]|jgi:two-component system NtrC family response regulator|nr:PEP-CTERM-box response regulator transcription factor [Verrucomicrobiota bacterium]
MRSRLLIVDDDENIRTQLKWGLADDYEVMLAEDRAAALAQFAAKPAPVVLLDLGLPPTPAAPVEGFGLLSQLLGRDPFCKVIITTGQSERENALRGIGGGAYDFLGKPIAMVDLRCILRRAFHVSQIEREHARLEDRLVAGTFEGFVGRSAVMEEVFAGIRKVAPTLAPVLVLGESGTGKELAARAIHSASPRKSGPFVAINCGAIPENLLESELFGYEKGSFTGAVAQRIGRVESASGGTLFLDEVGELSPALQVKLLRFLQDRTFTRVGGRREIEADVRLVAASNSDLKGLTSVGRFREDLYYRLAVVVIELPPLRERGNDVGLLAHTFLKRFDENHGRPLRFGQSALRAMERYHWPGNVRELENRVRRSVIMAEGRQISAGDLELDGVHSIPMSLWEAREKADRMAVEMALRRSGGNISVAAKELGISRPTLYDLMNKLGLTKLGQGEPP